MSLQPESGALGFMPFYYQRFAWSTRGWPSEAALAYLFLLCEQYSNGGLNPDPQVLEEIAPGTVAHWERIRRKFIQGPDGLLRNPRCEEIRAKSLAAGDRKRQQARNAAAKRWQCGSNAPAMQNDANDNESESDSESEIGNDIENKETHSLTADGGEPASVDHAPNMRPKRRLPMPDGALERLWALFPRKVGKGKALALLERAIREFAAEEDFPMEDACEVFREHIERMAQQYRSTEQQFIPHPATWLAQRRYLDPVPEAR